MSGPKITFIGAGSVEFTGMLIGDILGYPELREARRSRSTTSTPSGSRRAAGVARSTADAAARRPTIEAHADRRRALDGADYAINMIQVGGHAATVIDLEIPSATGCARRSATRSGSAASSGRCGRSR